MTVSSSVASQVACPVCKSVLSLELVSNNPPAYMITAWGESNSGGYALNTGAETWELASRSEMPFWNVNTSAFVNMDIGTNNNLDHFGLDSTTHGWELGTANKVKRGEFGDTPVYYVQTGQGGSKVADWNVGGSYWTKFLSRTAAAKAALTSFDVQHVVWVTIGINDAIAGTSTTTFKSTLEDIIARIKVELPNCKIILSGLPNTSTYPSYTTKMQEIADADADVYMVSVLSPRAMDYRDTNHWSYKGMKDFSARMVAQTQSIFGITKKGFDWTVVTAGGIADVDRLYVPYSNYHLYATNAIDATTSLDVQFETGPEGAGIVVAIDSDVSSINWGSTDPYYSAAYYTSGALYQANANGDANLALTHATQLYGRFLKSGNNLLLQTSTDGGTTWTTRNTRSGILSGVTSVRLKVLSAVVNPHFIEVWNGV